MSFFNRILKDIKRGKNIELYVLIMAAVLAMLLPMFRVDITGYIVPVGMAAIAVFSIALLGIKHCFDFIRPSATRVYANWGDEKIFTLLRKARSSIIVVDSWPCEATNIARLIKSSADIAKNKIKADFYFMDPDEPYGAQRIVEMALDSQELSADEAKKKFQEQFSTSVDRLCDHLKNIDNVEPHIYKYSTMPSLRLYVIDSAEYVFGWFPLGKSTSDAACFHLSSRSCDESLYPAIKELENELKTIQKVSVEMKEIV